MASSFLDSFEDTFRMSGSMNPWIGLSYMGAAGFLYWRGFGWWSLLGGCAGPFVYALAFFVVFGLLRLVFGIFED